MIAWAIDTAIGVGLMLVLVLAVRRPVARHFGARWAYALWLLPLARLLLPPVQLFPDAVAESLPAYTILLVLDGKGNVPLAAAAGIDWLALALAAWIAGAAVFAFWQLANYRSFLLSLGAMRSGRPPAHGGIAVVESDTVQGPLALGFVKPRIIVPADFHSRYSEAERAFALDHELIHHRRGDMWWNLAALFVLALNWFNPIAWIAFRAFRTDQELACDAAVARRIGGAERHAYACALVKSASRPGQILACPLNSVAQLKLRLGMMGRHDASRVRAAGGLASVALLSLAGLALSSAGFTKVGARAAAPPPVMVAHGPALLPAIAPPEMDPPAEAVVVERAASGAAPPAIAVAPDLPPPAQSEPPQPPQAPIMPTETAGLFLVLPTRSVAPPTPPRPVSPQVASALHAAADASRDAGVISITQEALRDARMQMAVGRAHAALARTGNDEALRVVVLSDEARAEIMHAIEHARARMDEDVALRLKEARRTIVVRLARTHSGG